jgi:hypothetical protein
MTPEEIRALLPGRTRTLPILDEDGRLIDFATDFHMPSMATEP